MSFRDRPLMFTPRPAQALLPHRYEYTRTTTCRDWSAFDTPSVKRMTARRIRNVQSIKSIRQAG